MSEVVIAHLVSQRDAILERLKSAPDLIPSAVEEILRYEPPVQFLFGRTTLAEVALAGTTIPRGVLVTLALAAGNRDPAGDANQPRKLAGGTSTEESRSYASCGSSMAAAAMFSSRCLTDEVPGMGRITPERLSSQARATCRGVA